jgi:hypothetical protein
MLKRIRPSIGSAHVIALLALFVALGGGYTVAFSGSGTVQKAKVVGFATPGFKTVRTLTGIGSVKASCDESTDTVSIQITDDATNPPDNMVAHVFRESDKEDFHFQLDSTLTAELKDTHRYHLFRADGSTAKRPQADVVVSVTTEDGEPVCPLVEVAVLVLNTEE